MANNIALLKNNTLYFLPDTTVLGTQYNQLIITIGDNIITTVDLTVTGSSIVENNIVQVPVEITQNIDKCQFTLTTDVVDYETISGDLWNIDVAIVDYSIQLIKCTYFQLNTGTITQEQLQKMLILDFKWNLFNTSYSNNDYSNLLIYTRQIVSTIDKNI